MAPSNLHNYGLPYVCMWPVNMNLYTYVCYNYGLYRTILSPQF